MIPMVIDLHSILLRIPAAFFALVLHEAVKARCSTMLGDPSPRNAGLMTGNLMKYIEPIGFILAVVFGFGWGRPTPTAPMYYKDVKKGIFITYLTPSLVNMAVGLSMGLVVGILNVALAPAVGAAGDLAATLVYWLFRFLLAFSLMSVSIALFNMIPVPPLDAAKLLQSALSPNTAVKMTQNEKVLQIVLMLLTVMGLIGAVIQPIAANLVNAAFTF